MAEQRRKIRLGELMVQQGLISQDQLRIALIEQEHNDLPLGRQLVRLGFVTEAMVRDMVAHTIGTDSIDLSTVVADLEALQMVPQDFSRRYHLLPVAYDALTRTMVVAMADMFNVVALDQLRAMLGGQIQLKPVLAAEAQLEEVIDQFYGYELSVDGILREIETGEIDYQSLSVDDNEYTQPVVRLVGALLMDAVKRGASDIHFEPEQAFLRIRYRIDGVLQQIRSLHKSYWGGLAVRLKVVSGLDIAETRAPQDGRLNMNLCGRPIDFRVSTHPTIHGENIVLRVLDREKSIIPMERMGLRPETLDELQLMMTRPEGILIVTGPTGSGKTTTLYSLLTHQNTESVNIMTLEDPVEYPVTMMRQTSVAEVNKVDFANGIRSIMRQDPDIILVGEIRDADTAMMAFRAAMTGHQVFSTLHTNSALGAFPRLTDIGILPDIMAGNIIGVVAQRLVRVLCPHCKEKHKPDDLEHKILQLKLNDKAHIYKPKGCKQCNQTGYRGRMAIIELLRIDSDMDALISRRAHLDELKKVALDKGFVTLAEDGVRRILEGYTSVAEVMRVIDLTSRISH
ncbi:MULTISPECIES: GspE/PulE family protein [Methylotenera]|jgi:general secretion pathway protein E/type IV pilus assembly protein PilB|uniref:Type II/IV secretion system protein n=1 Tax=Methylotenera mobilis TaxID=359408 RepID=A0A351R8I6_9PROT|nr:MULTISPECIES: GspE/PulE family protein [Methylotenera]MDP3212082.1 GspE/PulE family protein [Methylotenera sp.]PPC96049.1 MAG: type II/IV secretion system protein [Methylotenera sp.]HBA08357.1 type II/IV secretion system protein [Methylotenera mobilis]